jgi:RNA polymerase sigma-70 factor (ECF subfamily)
MTSTSDQTVIERILQGDQRAFGELLDRYEKVVYNAAYRVLGNGPDAEDVTQTVFLKVYENLATYNPKYRFFSWLYRIAINESVNARKRLRPSVDLADVTPVEEVTADTSLLDLDREEQIGQALMFLTPENRAILILRHYQEFSYREIAYIMDLSEAKIKARLFSARQRLGKILLTKGLGTEI